MRDALCVEDAYADVDFFPERGVSLNPCRAVCARCLVRAECAAYAFQHEIEFGVWGGTTGEQRREAQAAGLTAAELLERLDRPRVSTPAPARPPCASCGGRLARRDVGPWCWACAPSLAPNGPASSVPGNESASPHRGASPLPKRPRSPAGR
ncbi:MAG: WhiB family transcriptional regulator [Acidimicrobiia bacterium]